MLLRTLIASLLIATSGCALACRPLPIFPAETLEGATTVAVGRVTGVRHPALEAQIASGSEASWPGYSLHPYELRIAVSEVLVGEAPPVIEANASGCPPPFVPGDGAVIIISRDGTSRVWRESRWGSEVRALLSGAEG
jgi:hypothetical protein